MSEQKAPGAPKLGTRRIEAARRIKLYTKTGDEGKTSLYNGTRCNKAEPIFSTLGDLDELNCAIGMLITYIQVYNISAIEENFFRKIQYHIINISSVIATPGKKNARLTRITEEDIAEIERKIDLSQQNAPPLKQFILPGAQISKNHLSYTAYGDRVKEPEKIQSSLVTAQAHMCRAIARRAERNVLGLWKDVKVRINPAGKAHYWISKADVERTTLIYLNRLSDFFFAYSRTMIQFRNGGLWEITMEEMRGK